MKTQSTTTSTTPFLLFLVLLLQTATPTQTCKNLTASLTTADMTHHFFSGNEYTNVNLLQALISGGSNPVEIKSIADWDGMDTDAQINAGYLKPGSENILVLFDADGDVFRVDTEQGKVVDKTSVTSMFSQQEMGILTKGIQASAANGGYVFFFSGCKVLRTDFKGNTETLDLEEARLPCDVDTAMTYPRKSDGHLLITKGARAYGLFLSSSTPMGYDMFCVKDKLQGIGFELCSC